MRGVHIWLIVLMVTAAIAPASAIAAPSEDGSVSEGSVDSRSGAFLPLPQEREQELQEVQEELASTFGLDVRPNVSLLVRSNGQRMVVFHSSADLAGEATVKGRILSSTETGMETSFIFANDVDLQRNGPLTPLENLKQSPGRHEGRVVTVSANYTQMAIETESDTGARETSLIGLSSESRLALTTVFQKPTTGAVTGVLNTSSSDLGGSTPRETFLEEIPLPNPDESLVTMGFNNGMWMNAKANVNVLVVPRENSEPVFVVLDASPLSTKATVASAEEEVGEVVEIEANYVGAKVSTREVLLNSLKCAPDSIANPATGCFPVVTDTTVHAGVLVDGESGLPVIGLSNKQVDGLASPESGEYVIKGRIVDSDQVSFNTSAPVVMMAYEMERKGDLTISGGSEDRAREKASRISDNITDSITEQGKQKPSQWGSSEPNREQNPSNQQTTAKAVETTSGTSRTTTAQTTTESLPPKGDNSNADLVDDATNLLTNSSMIMLYIFLGVVFALSGAVLEIMRVIKHRRGGEVTTSKKPAQYLVSAAPPLLVAGAIGAGFFDLVVVLSVISILAITMGWLAWSTFQNL